MQGLTNAGVIRVVSLGMTDEELERLCRRGDTGSAPWIYWPSENYSFGSTTRVNTGYPKWLPLFVYSDHGCGLHTDLTKHELENSARVHLTWHCRKYSKYSNHGGRRVLLVKHPWMDYRLAKAYRRDSDPRAGTLVFFMHGTPSVEWTGHDDDDYFQALKSLPEKFHPIVLCLHMHDVNAGFHRKLRRHGFEIVTAGNTSNIRFVDEFYTLVRGFRYATAKAWGSYVPYCVEMGVPFFFFGTAPTLINKSDRNFELGAAPEFFGDEHRELMCQAKEIFAHPVDDVTDEQISFVKKYLGFDSDISHEALRAILWGEFFHHWRQWYRIPKYWVIVFLKKLRRIAAVNGE